MPAGKSQNLPGMPEQAAAVYRESAAQLPPASGQALARQAGHFVSAARFSLYEPEAIRRLHKVTRSLGDVSSLSSLLPAVLDGALWLTGADFGDIQLIDPAAGSLKIITQSGFGPEFLDYFAVVDDGHSACGRAAQAGAQVVIADVTVDPGFAPHRDIAAASGFRAVQSTPLVDHAARLIGIVSTHFRRPHRTSGTDLQIMELYGDYAGEALARHLGTPSGEGPGAPISQAVMPALRDLGISQPPDVTVVSGPGSGQGGRERRLVHPPAPFDETMSRFAGDVVNRLFSIGLSLDSTLSITGNGPAGNRIAAATDELDRLIRDIRTMVFGLADDREQHPLGRGPDRWTLAPGGPPPPRS
jgi:hypothetical protein